MRSSVAILTVSSLLIAACSGSGPSDTSVSDPLESASTSATDSDSAEAEAEADDGEDDASVDDAAENDAAENDAAENDAAENDAAENDAAENDAAENDAAENTGTLDWSPCEEQSNPLAATECATLAVPLDHEEPDGDTIDIAIARVDTASGDAQIGSLVFNPGGPGGSGIEFLTQASAIIPVEVSSRFDLVAFDPRGVGASTALDCVIEIDDNVTLLAEGDDAGWQDLLDEAMMIDDECSAATLELAEHVGTNNAARDLDLLREALGDDGLTYVGYSYGTRLGATYAELFPDNVRALVLDAAVLPTTDSHELDLGQAEGFDQALENFAAACDADEDCILADVGPALDVIAGLRAEIAEVGSFETADPDRMLTPGEFELGIVAALYSKESWPVLAEGLFVAEAQQDGSILQVLGDQLVGRQPDGTYDNSQIANAFINCADDPARPDSEEVRRLSNEVADLSTYFDDLQRASTGCLGIDDAADPLIIGPADDAPPILVIGNTGDPATPYAWSQELAASLDSGVLYTVAAEGHTAYGSIECVTDPVNAYLVDLTVPEAGSSCSDNSTADFFVPPGESEVDQIISLFDCLRDNGADVPEIGTADILADPTGEGFAEFLDPNDPTVVAAVQACSDILLELQGS